MDVRRAIDAFLESGPYAVVGASVDRRKYGNKVLRCYLQHGKRVWAVNPAHRAVEGVPCFPTLAALPEAVRCVSVITPPPISERIVEDLPVCGAAWVWMQPGAESPRAVRRARELGLQVVAGGPCLLVSLGFRDGG